jgi:hypothetical protein
MSGSPSSSRQSGRARDVLDWIAYMELCAHVRALCDSVWTANAVMPSFLKGCAAARRGRSVTPDESHGASPDREGGQSDAR